MSERAHEEVTDVEFTLEWYREFLRRLRAAGYRFRPLDATPARGDILLRHDVDLSVQAALEMARLEADLDVSSTYLFLVTSPLYNPFESAIRDRIETIASLGHDVGLHFSTHEYWPDSVPDEETLSARVEAERATLDRLLETDVISTISFHIPPEWVLDRRLAGVDSAYDSARFSEIGYVADSGQRWREEPPRVEALAETAQILTHPGLWGVTDEPFRQRIDGAIEGSCRHARRHALREFVDGPERDPQEGASCTED